MNNNGIPAYGGGRAQYSQYGSYNSASISAAPAQPGTVHEAMPEASLRMQGRYSHAVVQVKPQTLDHLRLADAVQKETQRLLPHGAGNQWLSVLRSQGESYARAHLARGLKKEFRQQTPQLDRMFNSARTAAILQGGNCQEFADVAYTLLAGRGAHTPVSSVSYRNDHVLVMLGDPRESDEDVTLVDAWPDVPVATTLRNSRINPNDLVVKKQFYNSQGSPEAQWALSGIQPMSNIEANQRMQHQNFSAIGPELVQELAEGLQEQGLSLYGVRTISADPSIRYTDGYQRPASFDHMSGAQLAARNAVIREYDDKVEAEPLLYKPSKDI